MRELSEATLTLILQARLKSCPDICAEAVMRWLRQTVTRRVYNPEDREDILGDCLVSFFAEIFPKMDTRDRLQSRSLLETSARFRISRSCRTLRNNRRILSGYRNMRHPQHHVDAESDAFSNDHIERNPPKLRRIMRMYASGMNSADVGKKVGVSREYIRVLKNRMVI